MRIIFAGTSHGVPEKNAFCSTTFLEVNGSVYIIDGGAPISKLLIDYGLKHEDVKAVFVTHRHCDHIAGLYAFATELNWYYLNSHPTFYFPEQSVKDIITSVVTYEQNSKNTLDMRVYDENLLYDDGNIRVTARRTQHINTSYSFVIEAEGKKLFFSGDMKYGYTDFEAIHRGEHFDLMVCEAAHNDERFGLKPYMGANTGRMILNHIYPARREFFGNFVANAPFKCEFAHDGMITEL